VSSPSRKRLTPEERAAKTEAQRLSREAQRLTTNKPAKGTTPQPPKAPPSIMRWLLSAPEED
jgi:hypothetical protein